MPFFQPLRASSRQDHAIRMPSLLTHPQFPVALRPIKASDEGEWLDMRSRNAAWLAPWESGSPTHEAAPTFAQWVAGQRVAEQRGTGVVFAIVWQDRMVGQVSIGAISYGAMRVGTVGYWVDEAYAGRWFVPMALCLLADWALLDPEGPQLHRLEIAVLPNNQRSLKVMSKVGATHEGVRRGYMYVNGQWRDHEVFVMQVGDAAQGFADRLITSAQAR